MNPENANENKIQIANAQANAKYEIEQVVATMVEQMGIQSAGDHRKISEMITSELHEQLELVVAEVGYEHMGQPRPGLV